MSVRVCCYTCCVDSVQAPGDVLSLRACVIHQRVLSTVRREAAGLQEETQKLCEPDIDSLGIQPLLKLKAKKTNNCKLDCPHSKLRGAETWM